MTSPKPAHKRILLKLSGEALMGDDAFGINPVTIDLMVKEIAEVVNSGVELAIVIDVATLTGACMVALGEHVAGLFTKDDKLADSLFRAGQKTADHLWRMPMWDSYKPLISSDVADVKNVGGRWGGAITAAKFLEHWTMDIKSWAHIDIAGPAFPNSSANYTKTFMTGFGVRLLIEFIEAELQKK